MRPVNQFPASPLSPDSSGGQHLPMAVLRQYVAGTLTAAEQHRVEAHTLTCTRCADVLEGLSQTDLATTDRALTDLQARLRTRVAEPAPDAKPTVPLWSWRQMVAAVLLLLVGTAVWLGVRRTTEGPAAAATIAKRQPTARQQVSSEPEVASAPAATDNAPASDMLTATAPAASEEEISRKAPQRPAPAMRPNRRQRTARTLTLAEDELFAARRQGTAAMDTNEDGKAASRSTFRADSNSSVQQVAAATTQDKPEYPSNASPKSKAAASKAAGSIAAPAVSGALEGRITSATPAPAGTRLVRGRVTDRNSSAGLPGVTVLAKGTGIGASTAADGSFALLVPDSVKTLAFSFIGYTYAEQTISTADTALALAMAPDTKQLNEVVVVRRERPPAPISIGALPAGGYTAFREYLKKELEYPEKALKDGKEGTVKLRFVVAADGSLQDIKVISGLSEECDAEAIRLLKEGPKWYPAISKGRRTARTVDVSVPFRLRE